MQKIDEKIARNFFKQIKSGLEVSLETHQQLIEISWKYIEFIKDPCEEIQLMAVKKDFMSLVVIKNPSKNVQKAALNQLIEFDNFLKNKSLHPQYINSFNLTLTECFSKITDLTLIEETYPKLQNNLIKSKLLEFYKITAKEIVQKIDELIDTK